MKRILTGIKPTGEMQLGNYLGMIKNIVDMQNKFDVFLMIADLHAQTVPYEPKELNKLIYDLGASLIALGIDSKKLVLFRQSDIPAHLYLYWILGCLAPTGELMRMHEYKEQKERFESQGIGSGILMYPVLQAADILIYNADLVPIGQDQVQHLELSRELAKKFNNTFGQTFKVPEIYIQKETAKIMSLDNPTKKMSKSLPAGNLEIFASDQEIRRKIKEAVTDSAKEIKYDLENKPAISNLISIYKFLTNKNFSAIEQEFKNKGYVEFKEKTTNEFLQYFNQARKIKQKITKSQIDKIFANGAKRANNVANKTLKIVLNKTGLK